MKDEKLYWEAVECLHKWVTKGNFIFSQPNHVNSKVGRKYVHLSVHDGIVKYHIKDKYLIFPDGTTSLE